MVGVYLHVRTRVSKKTLFGACKLASKYKVTWHARNMLTKNGSSTLRSAPGPQKVSDPHHKGQNFKVVVQISLYAHLKALDDTSRLYISQNVVFTILLWNIHGKRDDSNGYLVFRLYLKNIGSRVLWIAQICFSRQELSNEHTMSLVRQFWIFDLTIEVAELLGAKRDQNSKEGRHL